jgi:uncharacterized membrane-anchored protein YhcB (DUF1043 family)
MMKGNDRLGIRYQRVFEAVVISVISGIFAGYIAVQRMEVQLENLQKQTEYIQKQVDDLEMNLYQHSNYPKKNE